MKYVGENLHSFLRLYLFIFYCMGNVRAWLCDGLGCYSEKSIFSISEDAGMNYY